MSLAPKLTPRQTRFTLDTLVVCFTNFFVSRLKNNTAQFFNFIKNRWKHSS